MDGRAEKTILFFVFLVFLALPCYHCEEILTGSPVAHTVGLPWPMPQVFKPSNRINRLSPETFRFNAVSESCDILADAADRYFKIIFSGHQSLTGYDDNILRFRPKPVAENEEFIQRLDINLRKACEKYPSLDMNEEYKLVVGTGVANLSSSSIWGILRGLETFSQLIWLDKTGQLTINETTINDYPRFKWRGVLLDSARHYLAKEVIMQNLDAMAYNKMNVFHWHIVDDQSFPYQSAAYPDLSLKGSYDPYTHVYSQENVQEIIEYARFRGIRVVPEFDTPGHSHSWGKSQTDLLTKCYDKAGKPTGKFGPVDPVNNATYKFLQLFMKELTEVFADKYLHLGGDEVSFSCWKSNPVIKEFMTQKGYGQDYSKLEEYYMQRLLDIVGSYNSGYIVWQEVLDNGVKVNPDTVVQIWRGGFRKELAKVTNKGFQSVLSTCWYLNRIHFGRDWPTIYQCDPHDFNGTAEQKKLVLGGEMCMWGEFIDGSNLISRTWPRGCAVAERLWSDAKVTKISKATPRLEEQRCRMIRRGLNAEPVSGPGHCRYEYKPSMRFP